VVLSLLQVTCIDPEGLIGLNFIWRIPIFPGETADIAGHKNRTELADSMF
jgi:hypothetical protein